MTAALEGVRGQQHVPVARYPRDKPGIHFTGGWVGPRADLDGRKISSPLGFDPGPSSPQSVAIPTELPGPNFPIHYNIKILYFQSNDAHLWQNKPYFYASESNSVTLTLQKSKYVEQIWQIIIYNWQRNLMCQILRTLKMFLRKKKNRQKTGSQWHQALLFKTGITGSSSLLFFCCCWRGPSLCVWSTIYYISAVATQHIKSVALLQLVTFGYMFRPLPGHHQANKEVLLRYSQLVFPMGSHCLH